VQLAIEKTFPGETMQRTLYLIFACSVAATCTAGETCCQCQSVEATCRTCVPRIAWRIEKVDRWSVACEEICIGRPRRCGEQGCDEKGCSQGGCGGVMGVFAALPSWCDALGGGKIRPRNRLMRKTEVRYVPVVEWDVCTTCPACRQQTTKIDVAALVAEAVARGPDPAARLLAERAAGVRVMPVDSARSLADTDASANGWQTALFLSRGGAADRQVVAASATTPTVQQNSGGKQNGPSDKVKIEPPRTLWGGGILGKMGITPPRSK
jgi:hypothetical protein